MTSLMTATIALACLLAGAIGGMALRTVLPSTHLDDESTNVIKLAVGMMATLAALVLGLLISSANTEHNLIKSEYGQALASIVTLDRYLADYGPDTRESRVLLRHTMVGISQSIWPKDDFGPEEPPSADRKLAVEILSRQLLQLSPQSDGQKWYLSQALQIVGELRRIGWILNGQRVGSTLPALSLVILVSWTAAIFLSFGLFTRRNPTVFVSLLIAALAVASAILLILELDNPFSGFIQIPSGGAHAILDVLGK